MCLSHCCVCWRVQSRAISRKNPVEVREGIKYNSIESSEQVLCVCVCVFSQSAKCSLR